MARSLSPRERKLAGVTLAVLAGAGLFQGFVQPRLERHAQLGAELDRWEVTLTRMRANMRIKDQIEARYERLKSVIRESGSPSEEMSQFAKLLTDLYGPLGVQIKSVRPLPDLDEGFYRKFTWRIEMEGPVIEVARFLAAVAGAADPIRVERAELLCKDRPDRVTASLLVTKISTTGDRSRTVHGGASTVAPRPAVSGMERTRG